MRNEFADIRLDNPADEFTDYQIWRALKDLRYALFEFERVGQDPPQRLVRLHAILIEVLAARGDLVPDTENRGKAMSRPAAGDSDATVVRAGLRGQKSAGRQPQ